VSARRELSAAVLLCLVGACVVLVGAGRAWTTVELPAGPLAGARTANSTGGELVPGVRALGLVGLAGVVALAATRRTGRTVVGVVLLFTGVGVVAAVLAPDLSAAALRDAGGATAGASGTVTTTGWPWLAGAGGVLLAAAGGLTALRGRSWPGLGQRYEAPAQSGAAAGHREPVAATERGLWEALDRGEDPTTTLGPLARPPADREADRT
jgi:uncharacterized membrane protein (TIGR02234 family)